MHNRLRSLLWLVLGLALGVGVGLYLGWVAWPTEFTDASPAILHESHREEYTLMVAHAYALDGDLDAARRRLHVLNPEAPDRALLTQTVDAILTGRDEAREIRPLVTLASDLGLESPAMVPYLPTEAAPTEAAPAEAAPTEAAPAEAAPTETAPGSDDVSQ